jgi:ATP/maltotriose-dependent transcriptional regulator MalT
VFWTYVVAALRTARIDIAASTVAQLQEPPASLDSVLRALVNDLSAESEDVVLVLDDYHVIDSHEVHDAVAFLVEHLPPRLHLMITTRADPPLPFARLRAAGKLVEIRAADLRFTLDEATTYLQQELGRALNAHDVATLEARTEGWIAALQLASLSMEGRDDISSFIAEFAGDDRYIIDYLAEQVLQRQPEDVREFLLQTSILERLSAPLRDAITGRRDGKAKLAALERANLFVVPLDDRRRWYRYHHLFADVLQAHLLDEEPTVVPELHRRASVWFENNNDPTGAIRHAVAANDFERAADLAELAVPLLRRQRQEATLRSWLRLLPNDVVHSDVLGCSIALADIRIAQGRLSDAVRIYDDALLLASDQAGGPPRGTADMHVGLGHILLERNDLNAAADHLRQGQDLGEANGMPQNPYRWRVAMARLRQAEGDHADAVRLLDDAERAYVSDFFPKVRPILALRARVQLARGDLDDALAWVRDQGVTVDDDPDYLTEFEHITLARVLLARHADDRSERWLQEAIRLLERLLPAAEAGDRKGVVLESSWCTHWPGTPPATMRLRSVPCGVLSSSPSPRATPESSTGQGAPSCRSSGRSPSKSPSTTPASSSRRRPPSGKPPCRLIPPARTPPPDRHLFRPCFLSWRGRTRLPTRYGPRNFAAPEVDVVLARHEPTLGGQRRSGPGSPCRLSGSDPNP